MSEAKNNSEYRRSYIPGDIEPHWRQKWESLGIYHCNNSSDKPKYYCLDYFPYPSGEGLHVGHCRNYVPTDVITRHKRMNGYNVMHPMGWDSFGEPTEQNAIRNNVSPREITDLNTRNYKRQMQMIGTSYDWTREIDSSSPEYYRWTQSMFLKMYQRGLAYRDTNWQWWCPTCGTTLSSHEISGNVCWRGHAGVTKKEIPAWFLRITEYADELITGLETVQWPPAIKRMQRNWIGRSEGVEIHFKLSRNYLNHDETNSVITTFTTRPDTIFGVSFIALAPEHPLVFFVVKGEKRKCVEDYVQESIFSFDKDIPSFRREVSGVFTGAYATNPISNQQIPVYVADHVQMDYGYGALMGVPAHDQRDFNFAVKYGLAIKNVIIPNHKFSQEMIVVDKAYVEPGVLVNSGPYDGLESEEAGPEIIRALEEMGAGSKNVSYHMRDWLISRQRYWGTPIPIIYCKSCGVVPVPENQLPVKLPQMEYFSPDGSGMSPLGRVPEFLNTECPECGSSAQRETDTMGGFACSSWYFLRFTSPNYHHGPFEKNVMEYWMPVDIYVGGTEHAVLHLLFARFWTKFLADEGAVSFREPFLRLVNQGQLHGMDGKRMSKSRGNVIIPDDIVEELGADTLRMYCMFMAPFDQNVDWNTNGINGIWRFTNRIWNLLQDYWTHDKDELISDIQLEREAELKRELHLTIKSVTYRIDNLEFNTMVSDLMKFVNYLKTQANSGSWKTVFFQESLETLILLLAPAAPFLAEELWAFIGKEFSVHQQSWPEWDDDVLMDRIFEIVIQIDGRKRSVLNIQAGGEERDITNEATNLPEIRKYLDNRDIKKIVYVPGKILNIVTVD